MSYLTDNPIDSKSVIAEVLRASDGAVVTFEGIVRDHNEGHPVDSIVYEAYRPMAEKEFDRIVEQIRSEHPQVAVACVHRLGLLRVGEASIVIAAASPHRAEAFAACRMLIDMIKKTVPIWKKERGPEGDEWVGWQGGAEQTPRGAG